MCTGLIIVIMSVCRFYYFSWLFLLLTLLLLSLFYVGYIIKLLIFIMMFIVVIVATLLWPRMSTKNHRLVLNLSEVRERLKTYFVTNTLQHSISVRPRTNWFKIIPLPVCHIYVVWLASCLILKKCIISAAFCLEVQSTQTKKNLYGTPSPISINKLNQTKPNQPLCLCRICWGSRGSKPY